MALPGPFSGFCIPAVKPRAGGTALQWPLPSTTHGRGDHLLTAVVQVSFSPSEQQHVAAQQILLKSQDRPHNNSFTSSGLTHRY